MFVGALMVSKGSAEPFAISFMATWGKPHAGRLPVAKKVKLSLAKLRSFLDIIKAVGEVWEAWKVRGKETMAKLYNSNCEENVKRKIERDVDGDLEPKR